MGTEVEAAQVAMPSFERKVHIQVLETAQQAVAVEHGLPWDAPGEAVGEESASVTAGGAVLEAVNMNRAEPGDVQSGGCPRLCYAPRHAR